jgi:cardiolipin synthase
MLYLTIIGGVFLAWFVITLLFTPHIPFHIEEQVDARSDHFLHALEAMCQTHVEAGNRVEILTNGDQFYPAMLEAIRNARETVNMEVYIFKKGGIGDQFIEALRERAATGVRVSLVMDAIGSFGAYRRAKWPLKAAGARVAAYQRLRQWYRFARLNNRTHRELLIVDGEIAFVGGAGVAEWWARPMHGKPMWRDMMARIEGPVVNDVQGVFAENWTEVCGEILTGPATYKPRRPVGQAQACVIKSSPADRSTASRVLFQTLIEAATSKVLVTTPYFLPDKAFRKAIVRTMASGVKMSVIVPGHTTDQRWVRLASRRMYGQMLQAGVRIFEYQPGMTHVKALLVDDLWAVVGTTNLDNRSFEHNDEVNVAFRDATINARLTRDFDADQAQSREIDLDEWRRRPLWEKLIGTVAWILERQQ